MKTVKHPVTGRPMTLVATRKLTPSSDASIKHVPVKLPQAIVLFIGGAGDKKPFILSDYTAGYIDPNKNILNVKKEFLKKYAFQVSSGNILAGDDTYFGYYEIYGDDRIKQNILPLIKTKSQKIIIIGHSLGGWNGIWLSKKLRDLGYRVELLITLDPVGTGLIVETFADIYKEPPIGDAQTWINLEYGKNSDGSDVVALAGGRFNPKGRRVPIPNDPDVNEVIDVNHFATRGAMDFTLSTGKKAWDYLDFALQ